MSEPAALPPEITNTIGLIFLLERRLEYLFDRVLEPFNLTAKQWLLLSVIEKSGIEKPSIQEAARQLNTSHQNVKAIAVNLEKRGFLVLEKDPRDKRITRLSATAASQHFWDNRAQEDYQMFMKIFQHLSPQEVQQLAPLLFKLLYGVQEMTEHVTQKSL